MKRPHPRLLGVLLVALVAGAAPAGAHEEIAPSSVVTGRAAFLTFTVANERQVAVTGVTLAPPAGLELGPVTREPQGWVAARAQGGITWSGGSLASGTFEQWGVELEAPDQPGAFTFRSTLAFADGRTDSHDVPLTVSAASAAAPVVTTTTATAATATSLAVSPASTSPASGADDGEVGSARRQANLALAVGGGGLVVALVALVLASRRPRSRGAATPPGEQEW